MKYSIIICNDQAGQNIKNFLKLDYIEVNERSIYYDKEVDGDVVIFATTHRSAKGVKSLSVHSIGNFGKAELGGKDKELGIVYASLVKDLLLTLKKKYNGEVTIEATHHGPYLKKPCIFIEIGCSEKEWEDPLLGQIIGSTLNEVIGKENKYKTVCVLGGGHYNQEANKIIFETDYAVGHICPKHNLVNLDVKLLKQMEERSVEKIDLFVIDWKGMSSEKERILKLLDEECIKYIKNKEFGVTV